MRIHFIGIGGIGISALAQYYLKTGHKISGSDLSFSEITDNLKKLGIKIYIGHKKTNLPKSADLVLFTPAVKSSNPELAEAKKRGVKAQIWEEALGELTKKYFTIAVSGSHGKTTTTALISLILIKAGCDPTVIIGTKLKEFGNSNFRFGKSSYLVIESDEYKSSFLNYWPSLIVLTNLEYEHPDYFKNFKQYLGVFKNYLSRLNLQGSDLCKLPCKLQGSDLCKLDGGVIVGNKDDKNVTNVIKYQNTQINLNTRSSVKLKFLCSDQKVIFYSFKQKKDVKKLRQILKISGCHNIYNALAALAVARLLKIPDKISFKALSQYQGAWRRFEIKNLKVKGKNFRIVSDYGHHPTQVRATIQAAREKFPKSKIWIVYQAHQYLRTYYLFKDYVKAFDGADEVVLPEIYMVSGREKKEIIEKLSAKDLVLALKNRFKRIKKQASVHFLENYEKIPEFLLPRVKNNDVVILMGAGDIYKIIPEFKC